MWLVHHALGSDDLASEVATVGVRSFASAGFSGAGDFMDSTGFSGAVHVAIGFDRCLNPPCRMKAYVAHSSRALSRVLATTERECTHFQGEALPPCRDALSASEQASPQTFVTSQGFTPADGVNGFGPLLVWSGVATFELRVRDRRHLLRAVLCGFLEHYILQYGCFVYPCTNTFQQQLNHSCTTIFTVGFDDDGGDGFNHHGFQHLAAVLGLGLDLSDSNVDAYKALPASTTQSYFIAHLHLSRRSKTHFLDTHLPHAIAFIDRASGPPLCGRLKVSRKIALPT